VLEARERALQEWGGGGSWRIGGRDCCRLPHVLKYVRGGVSSMNALDALFLDRDILV